MNMFADFSSFDAYADDMQDSGSFDLLPDGWYQGFISSAEMRETKFGGQMISAVVEITGPSHAGRKVFQNFNWVSSSEMSQQIGRQKFAGLVRAIGLQRINDLDDVVNLQFDCKVKTQKSKDPKYDDSNTIVQFAQHGTKVGGAQPAAKPVAPQAPKPAAPKPAAQRPAAAPQRPVAPRPQARGEMPWEKGGAEQVVDTSGEYNPF